MTILRIPNPIDEGYQAYLNGQSINTNRYSKGASVDFDAWEKGWSQAREEEKQISVMRSSRLV